MGPSIGRLQVDLTGFQGAPGINSWFLADVGNVGAPINPAAGVAAANALTLFYETIKDDIQADVTARVLPEVAELDSETGELRGITALDPAPGPVNATGVSPASHATMVKMRLRTDTFSDGRRIQGGPFIGPVKGQMILGNGSIDSTRGQEFVDALETCFASWVSEGLAAIVWRRPRPASSPLGPRPGELALVTSVSYFPRPAVLRSRRD